MVNYIKFALHFPYEGLFCRAKYIIRHFSFFAFFLHLFCHSSFRKDQLTFFFLNCHLVLGLLMASLFNVAFMGGWIHTPKEHAFDAG